ncbi:hypothetical protein ACFL3M_01785 [Patescibacteria group bacterium]
MNSTVVLLAGGIILAILLIAVVGQIIESAKQDLIAEQEKEKREKEVMQKKVEEVKGNLSGPLLNELRKRPNISGNVLKVLRLASIQEDIQFDLESEERREVVPFPTEAVDYVPICEASDLHHVSPAQMALDDDQFYHHFITEELIRPEYYGAVKRMIKRMYILWDISPSMYEWKWGRMKMPNGEIGLRDTWARAILASLLSDAIEGAAEYYLRPFSSSVHKLRSATNEKDAEKLLSWVVGGGARGSGTSIGRAVRTAVDDIHRFKNDNIKMNHILLVTDGEDNGGLTRDYLVNSLGSNVTLSVVLIGVEYDESHPLAPYVIEKY